MPRTSLLFPKTAAELPDVGARRREQRRTNRSHVVDDRVPAERGIGDVGDVPRQKKVDPAAGRNGDMRGVNGCLRWQRHPLDQRRGHPARTSFSTNSEITSSNTGRRISHQLCVSC